MHLIAGILAFFGLGGLSVHPPPKPPDTYLVRESTVSDEKSVFATVESTYVVPARVRTGGTILSLSVKQGDHVDQGQVIAVVGDQKLGLQVQSYQAQVEAAEAQVAEAKLQFGRAQRLLAQQAIATSLYDQARTSYNIAVSNLKSLIAQRAVIQQQQTEGQVLAPTAGRVITVPVTTGTVVMAGDAVATVAQQNFVLRLEIPERHARYLHIGDPVRLDGADLGQSGSRFGTITLLYPQVDSGHVVADAKVPDLEDYFVGQRVRVWVSAGKRTTIAVPARLITTRFGIDYARVWASSTGAMDVPVQRGQELPRADGHDEIEILSGLRPGDRLLPP